MQPSTAEWFDAVQIRMLARTRGLAPIRVKVSTTAGKPNRNTLSSRSSVPLSRTPTLTQSPRSLCLAYALPQSRRGGERHAYSRGGERHAQARRQGRRDERIEPMKHSANQPINKSTDQPVNQSTNQSTNQCRGSERHAQANRQGRRNEGIEPIKHSTNRPLNQSTNQPSTNQPINQSTNQSVQKRRAVRPSPSPRPPR